ncbi:MAG: TetR/AcrR family transcriptional regulator [Chloroflexi bacterium]|nr:TetR/AcrR family transcriptional regulator [Chloroflexota bacterium]MBM3172247.1 TetR/AcrR family transcriptional regulator [Chloroflexota bacterium]MBM3174653.1 TetR/AcrR family transcriptional regulator [Chloroflexota bacterium]MBM4450020.1 TetR/AcrR family transcriptional regulator [Chloroflexota bacterium]
MVRAIRAYSNDEDLVRERRDYIARNSAKVLVQKGFERTTVQELADACAMSVGSLYRYFGSKEDILYYFIDRGLGMLAESVEGYLEESESLNPTEALEGFIRMYYRLMADDWNLCLFAYQETKNLDVAARRKMIDDASRDVAACECLLRRGIESGEFKIENPTLMAHNIIVLAHMWAVRRWFLRKRFNLEEYIRMQTDAILKLVGAKEQEAVTS